MQKADKIGWRMCITSIRSWGSSFVKVMPFWGFTFFFLSLKKGENLHLLAEETLITICILSINLCHPGCRQPVQFLNQLCRNNRPLTVTTCKSKKLDKIPEILASHAVIEYGLNAWKLWHFAGKWAKNFCKLAIPRKATMFKQ